MNRLRPKERRKTQRETRRKKNNLGLVRDFPLKVATTREKRNGKLGEWRFSRSVCTFNWSERGPIERRSILSGRARLDQDRLLATYRI